MLHHVAVFYNSRVMAMVNGLQPGDWLERVADEPIAFSDGETDTVILEEIFARMQRPVLRMKTFIGGRSLSVGDVITIDSERSYECDHQGWRKLPVTVKQGKYNTVKVIAIVDDAHTRKMVDYIRRNGFGKPINVLREESEPSLQPPDEAA